MSKSITKNQGLVPLDTGSSIAVQEQIQAAHQFDGTRPAAAAAWAPPSYKYPAGVAGGLFDFGQSESVAVTDFQFDFGGNVTSWSLFVVTLDAADVVTEQIQVAGGANVAFATKIAPRIMLGVNQALKLVTVGGTGAMTARVWAQIERGYRGA